MKIFIIRSFYLECINTKTAVLSWNYDVLDCIRWIKRLRIQVILLLYSGFYWNEKEMID